MKTGIHLSGDAVNKCEFVKKLSESCAYGKLLIQQNIKYVNSIICRIIFYAESRSRDLEATILMSSLLLIL